MPNKSARTIQTRDVAYEDPETGRWSVYRIPVDAPDSHAPYGVLVGPPDLTSLDLPAPQLTVLHNQLFNRGILTFDQARRNRTEVQASLMMALQINTERLYTAFYEASLAN